MPVPCFLLFLVSEKYLRKYSRNWTVSFPKLLFCPTRSRSPKEKRRRGPRGPHHVQARRDPWPREDQVWAPRGATDFALSPTNTPQTKNPSRVFIFSSTGPEPPPSSTPIRERSELLPSTLPGGGIVTGGLYVTIPASGLMRE